MLVASEVKGELARIHPARACCRRAELAGLLFASARRGELRTLDHATARTAVYLAASMGVHVDPPLPAGSAHRSSRASGGRHHLRVRLDPAALNGFAWEAAPTCDRRAFLRGVVLGGGSISWGVSGAHVEFVFRDARGARLLAERLGEAGVRALVARRRDRHLTYLKGHDEIAALLRLVGANRGLLELETSRVGREVRSRLNRLLNAEQANLGRTVRAADRQLQAIGELDATGQLRYLSPTLREAAAARRRQPDADLDALAASLGVSRSATNHRLRRLVELAVAGRPAATHG